MWSGAWNKAHFRNLLQKSPTQQIPTKLSCQSIEIMIQRLWIPTPLWAIFDEIYLDLCNFKSVR